MFQYIKEKPYTSWLTFLAVVSIGSMLTGGEDSVMANLAIYGYFLFLALKEQMKIKKE